MDLPGNNQEILAHDRQRQTLFSIGKYWDDRQGIVDYNVRARYVDWIANVSINLNPKNVEILYLAVKLFDRYLDLVPRKIRENDLKPIVAAALCLACKFEDQPLSVAKQLHRQRDEIIALEFEMFEILGYNINIPISYRFLVRFAQAIDVRSDSKIFHLASFILETSLIFHEFVTLKDDYVAAGALLLALRVHRQEWDHRLTTCTTYTMDQVVPIMWLLNKHVRRRQYAYPKLIKIDRKYRTKEYSRAARMKLFENPKKKDFPKLTEIAYM